MTEYQILYRGKWPVHDRDAESVAMVVTRGGEHFQFVQAVVSGIALITEHGRDSKSPGFWSGAARASVPMIEDAVRAGRLPLEDPTTPFEVIPGSPIPVDGPILRDGDVVGGFSVAPRR